MDVHVAQELLNELGSAIENLETQQNALFQFLKDKGIVADDDIARYLTEAGDASNIRWRAARVRLEHLIEASEKEEERKLHAAPKAKEEEKTPQPQSKAATKASKAENEVESPAPQSETKETTQETKKPEEQPEQKPSKEDNDRSDTPSTNRDEKSAA